jgi:hypothetical protein
MVNTIVAGTLGALVAHAFGAGAAGITVTGIVVAVLHLASGVA